MNGIIDIANLGPKILQLTLQRDEIVEQKHRLKTLLERNRKLVSENLDKCECVRDDRCTDGSDESCCFFVDRARQFTERMSNEERYLETKENQIKAVEKCIDFLEFAQSRQQVFNGYKIVDKVWRTTSISNGPQILQDDVCVSNDKLGNDSRILTIDMGNGFACQYTLAVGKSRGASNGWEIFTIALTLSASVALVAFFILKKQ